MSDPIFDNIHFISSYFPNGIDYAVERKLIWDSHIVDLLGGAEMRMQQFYYAKRHYRLSFGALKLDEAERIHQFFDQQKGAQMGFLWLDQLDYKSCSLSEDISATDQLLGSYDGQKREFQLVKNITNPEGDSHSRAIIKPKNGTVEISINDEILDHAQFELNDQLGRVRVKNDVAQNEGDVIKAGFEFFTPVRFVNEALKVELIGDGTASLADIELIEILPKL